MSRSHCLVVEAVIMSALSMLVQVTGALGAASLLVAGAVHFMTSRTLQRKEEHMLSVEVSAAPHEPV